MWTVTFQPQKEQVGTLTISWTLADEKWEHSVSVDLAQVLDLTPWLS